MSANNASHSPLSKTIWKHNPTRIVIGTSLLAIACAVVGWFCYAFAPEVTLILCLFSIISLFSLLKHNWVTVKVQGSDLLYTYISFFKKHQKVFHVSQIKNVESKKVTLWNQQKVEKLFLIISGEELVLSPLYLAKDEKIVRFKKELYFIPVKSVKTAKKIHPVKKTQVSAPRENTQPEIIWGMIEMCIACPRCDSPVMVNGPFTEFVCGGCGESIDFTPEIWTDLLEDTRNKLVEMKEGEGSNSTIWGTFNTSITYGRLLPYCKKCKRDYDLENDYSGEDLIICPDCGTTRPVQKPPDWFNEVFMRTKLIVGASRISIKVEPLKRDLYITCPNCGASILVSGATRNEKCKHCDSPVLLPDELWQHLHPPPMKTRWFVGFMA